MLDATGRFFGELGRHGCERLLKKTSGAIRFDLRHEHGIDHWHITISNGNVEVSREEREADTVIRADAAFFDSMVRGETRPFPAWLRNDITTEGEFGSIVLLERLVPPRSGARHPRLDREQGRRP
jgi:putative sterol carrier protein